MKEGDSIGQEKLEDKIFNLKREVNRYVQL